MDEEVKSDALYTIAVRVLIPVVLGVIAAAGYHVACGTDGKTCSPTCPCKVPPAIVAGE